MLTLHPTQAENALVNFGTRAAISPGTYTVCFALKLSYDRFVIAIADAKRDGYVKDVHLLEGQCVQFEV